MNGIRARSMPRLVAWATPWFACSTMVVSGQSAVRAFRSAKDPSVEPSSMKMYSRSKPPRCAASRSSTPGSHGALL